MKYFELENRIEDKAPFIEGMTEEYWLKVQANKTIRNIPYFDFPSFIPLLDGFLREPEEELRDYISTVHDNAGLLMSDRMKTVLEQSNLPDHRFYPAVIEHGKKRETNYWFFKTVWDVADYIDYELSGIIFYPKKGEIVKPPVPITSAEQFRAQIAYADKNRIGRIFRTSGKLFLNQKFNELDLY